MNNKDVDSTKDSSRYNSINNTKDIKYNYDSTKDDSTNSTLFKSMKNSLKQLEVLMVLSIIGLILAVGWLFYDKQRSLDKLTKAIDTITSTIKKDTTNTTQTTPIKQEAKDNGTDTPGTKVDTNNTANKTTTDPNAGYLVVKEWGLRLKVPAGLKDVEYFVSGDTISFFGKPTKYDVSYVLDYMKQGDNGQWIYAVGYLYRDTKSKLITTSGEKYGKKLGNYYYYTAWAFSSTASGAALDGIFGGDQASMDAELEVFHLINTNKDSLLNSIELAQ